MAHKRGQYTITYKSKKFPKKVIAISLGIGGLGFISLLVYKNWGFLMNATEQIATSNTAAQPITYPLTSNTNASSYRGKFSNESWLPYVFQYAYQFAVSPALILGIISQESGGNPLIVSNANAVGLMQVTPATAQTVLGQMVSTSQLMNPALNIQVGTAYLASMLSSFQLLPYALAAYNAGPTNASYYQNTLGYIPSSTAGDNVYSYVINVINYANQATQNGAPASSMLSLSSLSSSAKGNFGTVASQPQAFSTVNSALSPSNPNILAFEQTNTLNTLGFPAATSSVQ